jgi:16S rRNA processing protein RimM
VVKLLLYNNVSRTLDHVERVRLRLPDGATREVAIRIVGRGADHLLVAIRDVATREGAEALRGARIQVDRAALPPLEEGEYYYHDLVGCRVVDESGRSMGSVAGLFEHGASDVLVVRDEGLERYLPLVDAWIEAVDLEGRVIRTVGRVEDWESWEV